MMMPPSSEYPDEGGSNRLFLRDSTLSHPRSQCSYSPPWEHKISLGLCKVYLDVCFEDEEERKATVQIYAGAFLHP
jgi:hypothetical protein